MKDKKPKKAAGPKKEVKRPTHKKPRPKKYVEAKIPERPTVPTEQVPITKEAPPKKTPKPKVRTITLELQEGETEESFVTNSLKAIKTFYEFSVSTMEKDQAEAAKKLADEREKFLKLCGVRFYKENGDNGLIRRHNFPPDPSLSVQENNSALWNTYTRMLNEEKPTTGWSADYEYVLDGFYGGPVLRPKVKTTPAKPEPKKSWFRRLFGWF